MIRLSNKPLRYTIGVAVVLIAGLFAYHTISPKIQISNQSTHTITRALFVLPDSRVDFAPIPPGQSSTIYFDRQHTAGTVSYEVQLNDQTVRGSIPYPVEAQLFRVVRLNLDPLGNAQVDAVHW